MMGTMISCHQQHTQVLKIDIEQYDISSLEKRFKECMEKTIHEITTGLQQQHLTVSPAVMFQENSDILPSTYHKSVNTTEDSDDNNDSMYSSCSDCSGACSCCSHLLSESSSNNLPVFLTQTYPDSEPLCCTHRSVLREEDQPLKLSPMNLPQSRNQAFAEIQELPRPKMLPRSRSIFSSQHNDNSTIDNNVGTILQFIRHTNSNHLPGLLNV